MKCPICRNEMIKGKKYWICEEDECGKRIEITERMEIDDFDKNALENFPTIIAHEYKRLQNLSQSGETYGMFLQIKDVYEVILKFPVLIVMEGLIYSLKNEEESKERNDILRMFVSKPLSFGDWEKIAGKIIKLNDDMLPLMNTLFYIETKKHIETILKNYTVKIQNTSRTISSWRNEAMAHGALSFDGVEFREEIQTMTKNIHDIMTKSEAYYENLEVITKEGDVLKGHEIKRIKEGEELLIRFHIKSKGIDSSLNPFVCNEIEEICYTFLFDSFTHYSNTSYRLNYSHGKKEKCYKSVDTILELRKLLNVVELSNDSVRSRNHLSNQMGKIENILLSKNLIKPAYLDDYLKLKLGYADNLNAFTKGVFLLRTERGMGKTIFTRILDDLDHASAQKEKPSFYEKVIKRVYHINSTYGSELSTFKHKLQIALTSTGETPNAYIGHIRDEFSELDRCRDDHGYESLKLQFAKILNESFHELKKAYRNEIGSEKEKLLLVIDGLDEFNYKYEVNGKTIFDYIPRPDMLSEGIYILLTSRTHDELRNSGRLQRDIEEIVLSESYEIFNRESSAYVSLLKKHLENDLFISDEKIKNELLEALDYRFSHLGAYEKLYCSNLFKQGEINTGNLIKSYMSYLENENKRHFGSIKRLMLILAVTATGIRTDELCFLMNEDDVTYRLLGTIADMANFIECKRENGVTVMSISHQIWRENLLVDYNAEIGALLDEYGTEFSTFGKRLLMDPDQEGYVEFERDYEALRGQFYIVTNYIAMKNLYNRRNNIVVSDDELRENVGFLNTILKRLTANEYKQVHLLAITNFLHGLIEEIENIRDWIVSDIISLASAYTSLGMALDALNCPAEAMDPFIKVIDLITRLDNEGKLHNRIDLAKAHMNLGAVFEDLNRLQGALEEYEKTLEIMQELNAKGNLSDRKDLAVAHANLGALLCRLNRPEEALKEYQITHAIRRELFAEGKLPNENDLAKGLMNIGIALYDAARYDEALEACSKSMEIRIRLYREGKLWETNSLARGYINRGIMLRKLNRPDDGLDNFSKALEIRKKLDLEGKLSNRNELARAHLNMGVAYSDLGQPEAALSEYEKAEAIMKLLHMQGKLPDRNDLAITRQNKAKVLYRLNLLEAALEEYKQAMEVENGTSADLNTAEVVQRLKLPESVLEEYGKALTRQLGY